MKWALMNGENLAKGLNLRKKEFKQINKQVTLDGKENPIGRPEEIITFRWKHPPKSWWYAKKPIYIDVSYLAPIYKELSRSLSGISSRNFYEEKFLMYSKKPIFIVKKLYPKIPCGGWGILISKEEFLKEYKGRKDGDTKQTR